MPRSTSTSADVTVARKELGSQLRALRRVAGLTGRQLADALSWPPSKISKLENGRQTPSDDDVRAWCRVTEADSHIESMLASLHTLESRHAEWRRQLRGGLVSFQEEVGRRESATEHLRIFEPCFVPGLVQTPEYARHRFIESARTFGHGQDIDAAVAARMLRQDVLYLPSKRFHLVITEAVLHYATSPPDVMLGQIDRLLSVSMLPNVRLGVIGFDTPYVVAPAHGFWLHGSELVIVETLSAELNLAQPAEIELYGKAFEAMAQAAEYGRAARVILNGAGEAVSSRLPVIAE